MSCLNLSILFLNFDRQLTLTQATTCGYMFLFLYLVEISFSSSTDSCSVTLSRCVPTTMTTHPGARSCVEQEKTQQERKKESVISLRVNYTFYTSYCLNYPKSEKISLLQTWHFVKILPFLQCAQIAKQFLSADSASEAQQNSANEFAIVCLHKV